jgi:hypothetical protein
MVVKHGRRKATCDPTPSRAGGLVQCTSSVNPLIVSRSSAHVYTAYRDSGSTLRPCHQAGAGWMLPTADQVC